MSSLQQKEKGNSRSNDGEHYAENGASKKRSEVWDHFTYDEVTMKAICNHCRENLRGDGKAGTSHLKRHRDSCKKRTNKAASTDFLPSEKRITAEDTTAFGPQQLLFDRERNTGSVAPCSRNQKRDPFTQEQREDDPGVEKRARLKNGSDSRLGGALEIIVAELPRLVEQKQQQQEAQIKELKEALDHAKAEIREEKEASVAAEQKLRALTEERISLLNEKHQQEAQIKELREALDHAKAEIREEKEASVAAEQKLRALTEERISLLNEKLGWEDEAKRWERELDWMAKTSQLTELPQLVDQKQQQEAHIKLLKEALDHAKAEITEEKEARFAAELISGMRLERISFLKEKFRKEEVRWRAKINAWANINACVSGYLTRQLIRDNTMRDFGTYLSLKRQLEMFTLVVRVNKRGVPISGAFRIKQKTSYVAGIGRVPII